MQVTKSDNNNVITLEQVFNYVRKSDDEKFDDVLSISSNTFFYLKKFEKYGHRQFFFSLNWSFAFLGTIWMAYRKMYWVLYFMMLPLLFHFLAVIILILSMNNSKFDSIPFYSVLFYYAVNALYTLFFNCIAVAIPLLFMGNMIYFYHIKRRIRQSLSRKGISNVAVCIAVILSITNTVISIAWSAGSLGLANYLESVNKKLSSSNHGEPSEPY